MKYNRSYAKSVGTNEFFVPDTSRNPDENKYTRRNVQHVRNDADNAYEVRGIPDKDNDEYNKVSPQERHCWEHLLKSIVKFHSTDIHFLKNFKTNFSPT